MQYVLRMETSSGTSTFFKWESRSLGCEASILFFIDLLSFVGKMMIGTSTVVKTLPILGF